VGTEASDFPDEDPIRGKGAVYGWIQGRGLEALAGHCAWLRRTGLDPALLQRLEMQLATVLCSVRKMWRRNGGRLWFFMRVKAALCPPLHTLPRTPAPLWLSGPGVSG
jgi:hypothetical protein